MQMTAFCDSCHNRLAPSACSLGECLCCSLAGVTKRLSKETTHSRLTSHHCSWCGIWVVPVVLEEGMGRARLLSSHTDESKPCRSCWLLCVLLVGTQSKIPSFPCPKGQGSEAGTLWGTFRAGARLEDPGTSLGSSPIPTHCTGRAPCRSSARGVGAHPEAVNSHLLL